MDYHGRVVMITGAAQGLGLAMARRFAADGASLALCDINDRIKDVATTLTELGRGTVAPTVVDVTDPEQVTEWVESTVMGFGQVDVLVNNAGVIRDNRIERMSDEEWKQVIAVSLSGTFHCCRAVVPHMKHRGYGRIVSFSSMSHRGNFGQANYAAAKAAVVGMARTLALEGAKFGITSNVISPGLINTPMLASMDARAREKLAARVPAGRIGRPEEIAAVAAFLCSEQASYVTGVVVDVDGGISIGTSLR